MSYTANRGVEPETARSSGDAYSCRDERYDQTTHRPFGRPSSASPGSIPIHDFLPSLHHAPQVTGP
jgi:hypothetical protein